MSDPIALNQHATAIVITNKIIGIVNEETKKPDCEPTEILLGLLTGLKAYLKSVEEIQPKPSALIELEKAIDNCATSILTETMNGN